jgi:hypothetical protein
MTGVQILILHPQRRVPVGDARASVGAIHLKASYLGQAASVRPEASKAAMPDREMQSLSVRRVTVRR